jgi:hypothetical protein
MGLTTRFRRTKMQQTIKDFQEFISKNGGVYTQWYVGVAADPEKRLFNDHNVNKSSDSWIYSKHLGTDAAARYVEEVFLSKGCKGAPGGGDRTSCYAYIYKINGHTRE